MRIKINKYMLSYNGKIYQAGDEVDIADKKLAISLVENSGGNLEYSRNDLIKAAADKSNDIYDNAVELPPVDPIESVSGKKRGKN